MGCIPAKRRRCEADRPGHAARSRSAARFRRRSSPRRRSAAPTRSTRSAAPRRSRRWRWARSGSSAVDVIAGPGNRYVQEAKRQLVGDVGIDGIAGPSELMVIAGDTAECGVDGARPLRPGRAWAGRPAGRGRRGDGDPRRDPERGHKARGGAGDRRRTSTMAIVQIPDTEAGVLLANAHRPRAPRDPHRGRRPRSLARSTTAGCVFVGERSATAFGDYAAGSNHVLPTGGAGRFQGPLGPDAFRRRITTVEMTQEAARGLAPTVATLARAEGFPLHADSVEARAKD